MTLANKIDRSSGKDLLGFKRLHPTTTFEDVKSNSCTEDSGVHGHQNAQNQCDGKSPDLIRSDNVQHDSRYQRGKIGVNNSCCSPFKSVGDGHSKNAASAYFLADSFKDQYVCVHGHADSEHQACKPR